MEPGKGNMDGDDQKHEQETRGGTIDVVKRKVPQTKSTRSSARLRNQWLPFEVFDNELLRKKILGYAVFSGGNKTENRKTACSLRFVGNSWNETVIKLLYKRQEPLLRLSTYDNGKLLERFSNIFSTSIPINGYIPPFSVDIGNLGSENVNAFCCLLTYCGHGLVQLNIGWLPSWLSCKSQFRNLSLPRLCKLEIDIKFEPSVAGGEARSGRNDGKAVCSSLINSIARDATFIAEFKMTLALSPLGRTSQLSDLSLPVTITHLQLLGWMWDGDIDVLAGKPLPNLKSLALSLKFDLFGNGSVFRILDNYRTSLKRLTILDFGDPPNQPILFRFPIMEELEAFSFNSAILELEPGLLSLGKYFPKLRTLFLHDQTISMFRKWTENAKFIPVAILQFSLWNDQSLNMETMQSVNFAFPNVRDLGLSISGTETSGLSYLFREMTQLRALELKYCGSEPEVNSDFWDAVLTGIPPEMIAESREDPGFWERFDRNEEAALGSITNLQELTSLTLAGYWDPRLLPLISDVTFHRALLKMPNLKKLYLRGRFEASAEMAEVWRNGGRSLEYALG